MALLREISPNDPVTQLALTGFEGRTSVSMMTRPPAPILRDAQFYTRPGSADRVKDARLAGEKTKVTRSINEANSATAPTPTYSTPAKKIVSWDAKVDVVLEDRQEDPETELAHQSILESEEVGYELQELFFEGDDAADAEDFDGMRQLVDSSWVFTDGLLVPAGNADAIVEAQQLAVEKFKQSAARVRRGATHAYMNEYLKMRWITIAKNLGYYRMMKDELGDEVEMIGDIIIRGAGYGRTGTPLLPFTETDPVSNSSSIFFVRWGERQNLTCLTSVGVRGRYAGQSGNFITNNFNLDMTLLLQDATAMSQVKGWRLEQP